MPMCITLGTPTVEVLHLLLWRIRLNPPPNRNSVTLVEDEEGFPLGKQGQGNGATTSEPVCLSCESLAETDSCLATCSCLGAGKPEWQTHRSCWGKRPKVQNMRQPF